MEHLQDGHYVRLRSRVHGTYLHADKDGHGVSLHHRRDSMKAAWAVHLYQGNANAQAQHMLLHSAAYGRYLVATNTPAPLGHRGRRVEQRNYDDQEEEAIRWVAVGADSGSGNDVLLRNVAGRYQRDGAWRHLRANGRYIHTGVSVDAFDNFSTKMQWVVEPIPARAGPAGMPLLRRPIRLPFPGRFTAVLPLRLIMYVRAGADGSRLGRGAFVFKGKSVFHLRKKLIHRLEATMGVSDLAMCVEAGAFGRPTPLVVDLPRSRQNLHILVFAVGTPAHAGVRYPDVDAA